MAVLAVLLLARLPLVVDPAPSAARLAPAARCIDVVRPVLLPTAALPDAVALVPDPATLHPHLARARPGDHFIARRRRRHLHDARHVDVDVDLPEGRESGRRGKGGE